MRRDELIALIVAAGIALAVVLYDVLIWRP